MQQFLWNNSARFSAEALGSGRHAACSPFGAAMLAALFAPVTDRFDDMFDVDGRALRHQVEQLLDNPHPNVAMALTVWNADQYVNDRFARFVHALPRQVGTGPIPTRAEADRWTKRQTDGMLHTFPVDITGDTSLLAASALTARVAWNEPLHPTPTPDGAAGMFANVCRVLSGHGGGLYDTATAGRVAAHHQLSSDGVTVTSVMPVDNDSDVGPAAVLTEAHHIIQGRYRPVGLRQLDLGDHGTYRIDERTVPGAGNPTDLFEVLLPRWTTSSTFDLLKLNVGFDRIVDALSTFANEYGAQDPQAKQVVHVDYDTHGFAAAAVTAVGMRPSSMPPQDSVTIREATVRFEQPHAVVAHTPPLDVVWGNLPLFTAWVTEAEEPTPLDR